MPIVGHSAPKPHGTRSSADRSGDEPHEGRKFEMIAQVPKLKYRVALLLLAAALFTGPGSGLVFAQAGEKSTPPVVSPEPTETGLRQDAVEIARIFELPITNSMVVTWITALGLIAFAKFATRNMKPVPEGAQNLWEWLVEGLHTFLEGVIGSHLVKRTFWFFASIFIFILAANWVGLIPGVGTVGWGHQTPRGL